MDYLYFCLVAPIPSLADSPGLVHHSLVPDERLRSILPLITPFATVYSSSIKGPQIRRPESSEGSEEEEDNGDEEDEDEDEDDDEDGPPSTKSTASSKGVARSLSGFSNEPESDGVEILEDNTEFKTPIKQELRRSTRPSKQSLCAQDSVPSITRSQTRSQPRIRPLGREFPRPSTPPPSARKKGKKPQTSTTPLSSKKEKKTKRVSPSSKVIRHSELQEATPVIDPHDISEMVDALELSPVSSFSFCYFCLILTTPLTVA